MFGWFKKAPRAATEVAAPQRQMAATVVVAPDAKAAIPPWSAAAAPVAIAAAPVRAGRPAMMIAAARSRRVEIIAEQAGGRRLLVRAPGSQQTYAFAMDAAGNYYLGSATDHSAVLLIPGLPAALSAA